MGLNLMEYREAIKFHHNVYVCLFVAFLTPLVHECNTVQKKMLPKSTQMHQPGYLFHLQ